jgi:hypothetical protein
MVNKWFAVEQDGHFAAYFVAYFAASLALATTSAGVA